MAFAQAWSLELNGVVSWHARQLIRALFLAMPMPWNAMMVAAIIYVLPLIVLLFALCRYVVASLTMANVTE